MKIVQLCTQMESGGAQRVAILLAEGLRERGYDVEVWFLYVKRPTYLNFPGVRVLLEHKPSALDYTKILTKLWEWLRLYKPDVLITHSHYSNMLGQLAARLIRIPKRIAIQHLPLFNYPKSTRWANLVLGSTGFFTTNVAVSESVMDSAANYPASYRAKLTTIYNGIPSLKGENSLKEVRKHWRIPENVPLLINIGRLARQKNQAILLEALLHLPKAHLVIGGDGELKETLQKQVIKLQLQKRVHLLGEIEPQDVWKLLSISNVFVFPSIYESMGLAIVEAMSSGLPVIASDIPAIRETMGDAGILVPADSGKEIAKAVQKILDSPELARTMSEKSFKRARLFSLEKMVDSYEALFT